MNLRSVSLEIVAVKYFQHFRPIYIKCYGFFKSGPFHKMQWYCSLEIIKQDINKRWIRERCVWLVYGWIWIWLMLRTLRTHIIQSPHPLMIVNVLLSMVCELCSLFIPWCSYYFDSSQFYSGGKGYGAFAFLHVCLLPIFCDYKGPHW